MALLGALERLEWRWRSLGVAIDDVLEPGLSEDEILSSVRPIAEPHRDIIAWYQWHNGSIHMSEGPSFWAAPSGRLLTNLDEALALRQTIIDIDVDIESEPDDSFGHAWLPVADTRDAGTNTIAVDLHSGAVYRRDLLTPPSHPRAYLEISSNLEGLVNVWCNELDRGQYSWDPDTYWWEYDHLDQPRDLYEKFVIH